MENLSLTYEFIQTKTAELASILGLMLTIVVLFYSRSIRVSVEEGRRDLLRRLELEELLEQYSRLVIQAERCLDSALNSKWDILPHLVVELLKDLSYFKMRWEDQLGSCMEDLVACHQLLTNVSNLSDKKSKEKLQILQHTVVLFKESEARLYRRKEECYVPTKG